MDISPDKQNIDQVFSNTIYHIDFYQREYRWTKEPVLRLLDDIFEKFNDQYENNKSLDPGKETVSNKYAWYYLNTYVTNTIDGRVFVVDGQQRLTTLSLILIKLLHISKNKKTKLTNWIDRKILGQSGYENKFLMTHEAHVKVQNLLYEGEVDPSKIDVSSGITAENMVANYGALSTALESNLTSQHKLETFIFYFLLRVVLINLSVEQTDVPMVFEVINDRGVKLKPYEILKGKLLGQIDKNELKKNKYNELWENRIAKINSLHEGYEDEIDFFFRNFLKGKFSNNRKDAQKFDGDYHRLMFGNEIDEHLKLKQNPTAVKSFLEKEFTYYTDLYCKLLQLERAPTEECPYLFFNRLNDLDGHLLLILSACKKWDKEESEKIKRISYNVDRFFSLLQVQNAYDSNTYNDAIYKISEEIRDCEAERLDEVFDKHLIQEISTRLNTAAKRPLSYSYFKNSGIGINTRFKRYFLSRIEKFLADNMNLKLKHSIADLVLKTGAKSGFHIEHILSYNDENMDLFDQDEDRFEQERNRLGGILLLKGKDNISSNNESYKEKLKSYANTLYWNELLRKDTYKSKLDLDELITTHSLALQPYDTFGPDELEKRQKVMFDITKIIWA